MIWPQLTTLGSLRPRNESPASKRIALPTISAAWTTIGGRAFGRMTISMSPRSPAPDERDEVTYSISRRRRNSERVTRATAVQLTIPIANVTIASDAPNRATITIENSRVGRTWKNSVMRIRTSSTQPR